MALPTQSVVDTRRHQMYPKLEPAEIERLRRFGEVRSYGAGEALAKVGAVGHAFAINPDRTLAKVATEREWPTLSFTHKVRAHDRSRSRTPFVVSALVIGTAAVLGRAQLRRD